MPSSQATLSLRPRLRTEGLGPGAPDSRCSSTWSNVQMDLNGQSVARLGMAARGSRGSRGDGAPCDQSSQCIRAWQSLGQEQPRRMSAPVSTRWRWSEASCALSFQVPIFLLGIRCCYFSRDRAQGRGQEGQAKPPIHPARLQVSWSWTIYVRR